MTGYGRYEVENGESPCPVCLGRRYIDAYKGDGWQKCRCHPARRRVSS